MRSIKIKGYILQSNYTSASHGPEMLEMVSNNCCNNVKMVTDHYDISSSILMMMMMMMVMIDHDHDDR